MKRLVTILGVWISGCAFGQVCGTEATPEQLYFMQDLLKNNIGNASRTQNIDVEIPIKFHYVTRDDGTGALSESETSSLLQRVNSYYANADMTFFLSGGVNYINDSDLFDFRQSDEGIVAVANDLRGAGKCVFLKQY